MDGAEYHACVDCGRRFTRRRRGQLRCEICDEPVARARASYSSPAHRKARRDAIERDGNACAWCGSTDLLTMHHLERKADGGSDEHTLLLCGSDHSSYEAAERYDNDTPLRRFVRAAAADRST